MRAAACLLCTLSAAAALAQPVPEPRREQSPPRAEQLTPPRLLAPASPVYPPGGSGSARVLIQLEVDERGEPRNLAVVGAHQPLFDEAALAAARTLRFEPARLGDRPVPVRLQYAVQFETPRAEPPPAAARPVNLTGRVRERGTRRKLAGVEVSAPRLGVSGLTDGEGRFSLRGLPEESPVALVIAAPGYERLEQTETIPAGRSLEVEYRLQPLVENGLSATVEGERPRQELSRTALSSQEIERVAGTGGDALKIIEDLPGVARTSPIGGGFLVIRGSKPGDSLVYLDGEPIPLLYHFGAISSVVNPDLLEGIDFIPGNFSVRYGDLTGGLVEVRTRPLRDEVHGYANVNLLETSALVEAPLPAPGATVAVAARRSYIDYLLRAFAPKSDDVDLTVAPRYYDAELRLDWAPPGTGHRLGLFAISSDDTLSLVLARPADSDPNLSGSVDADTQFQQIRLKHSWSRGSLSTETVAMWERLGLKFVIGPSRFDLLGHDLFLRSAVTDEVDESLAFTLGVDASNRRTGVAAKFRQSFLFREGEFNQQGPRPDDPTLTVPRTLYLRPSAGLYGEARWRPAPRLTLVPGVRIDTFTYATADSHTSATVTPRLSARYELDERIALKAGLGLYSQGARNGDAARPFGNPEVLPERALQATLGVEVRPVPSVFASVEAFYKKLDHLIVKSAAVETLDGQRVPVLLDNAGTGRVFGLEVLVRKELTARLFGWIAYTLSRSDRVDRPGERRRLFDFDQTHNLTAIASYKLGGGWQLGGRLRIISGNPDTPIEGARYLANFDAYLPLYGPSNSTRLPTFHQLDVRVDKTWTFEGWLLDAYVDVLNAYDHRSIEGSAYSYDFSQHRFFEGLPIIPTLGVKGSF